MESRTILSATTHTFALVVGLAAGVIQPARVPVKQGVERALEVGWMVVVLVGVGWAWRWFAKEKRRLDADDARLKADLDALRRSIERRLTAQRASEEMN